jgi:integrase
MLPSSEFEPEKHGSQFRIVFSPSPKPITVERDLRKVCAAWQTTWDNRLADSLEAGPTTQADARPTITTTGLLFDHLFEERKATLKATTVERDRYHLGLWRRELGEATALHDLTEPALVAARGRIAGATSAATANDGFGILKTYLTWAFHQGLMPTTFFKTIKKLKIPPKERKHRAWWTAAEVDLALRCAREDHQAATAVLYVALGCLLGLRPEEAIMLRWQDVDLDAIDPASREPRPVAHITPHGAWTPKDGEARSVPICAALQAILTEFRKPSGYLLEAEVNRTKRKEHAPWAYRYDPKKVWQRVVARVVKAGGQAITAYGMRHTFASNLLIAGVTEFKVAKWLGHSDTRMVHKHYGHLRSYDADINAVRYDSPAKNEPSRASA